MARFVGERRADVLDRIVEVLNRAFNDAGSYRQNKLTADEILTIIESEQATVRPAGDGE